MYIATMRTDDLADELLRHAARLSRWANRHAELGMPWAQARVLSLVEELGPVRVTALAEADDTTQPTMTTQVQRLAADGLVSRSADPGDARASLVSLTGDGARALAGARRARARALAPVLEDVGPDADTLRAAVDLLAELLAASRTAGHRTAGHRTAGHRTAGHRAAGHRGLATGEHTTGGHALTGDGPRTSPREDS